MYGDGCMPHCIRGQWVVFKNTSSLSYSRVKSMCPASWTMFLDHIQWICLEDCRSKGIWKRPANSRPSLDPTLRGDSLGRKPRGYNNDIEEMCQSIGKGCFGNITKGSQWLQQRTVVMERLTLARTLSAVPAWVWQMQQINPYRLPLGI